MAIDGVKIIDSDTGYDVYNYVIENYKDGVSADKIIAAMLADEGIYCINDFYTEIYWTALAYSLWKIGHLPNEIKDKALIIIEKGADEFWAEIDSKAPKQRQKALDKLAVQLKSKNLKPVKVPKGKKKRAPYFNAGDVLAIKFGNEYGVCFVSSVDESPRRLEYNLACSRLLQTEKPNIDNFLNSQIACTKQNTSYCLQTDCWFNHKDLGLLLDKFEKIGQVELEDYMLGKLSPASTLEDIYDEITRNKKTWNLRFKDIWCLIKNFKVVENEQ
ncbi:hypothetical protein BMT54_00410 [Pasteurellaceae bacterium 15-036681]|nr:hypothetical protein BMT54_00410 [Pasteurellaceae bacterium 15-036681]